MTENAMVQRLAVLVLAASVALPSAAAAQVPPGADWRTIETAHFRVTFAPGLEALAVHAADVAEAARTRLAAGLASPPEGKVDILLTDFVDMSNGLAQSFPSNRIVLYARPPVDMLELAFFDDWMELVVTHELAHIFHLDATGGLGGVLRAVFGRVPSPWPLFPAVGTPAWSIEGLATLLESRYTAAGRVRGSYQEMVLRTAVLEGAFDGLDEVTGLGATWPGGSRAYVYGSMFAAYLARQYGPEVHRKLVSRTASAWIPTFLSFDRIASDATGATFTDAYRAWRAELEARYARLADSLRTQGLTTSERLTGAGYYALHPRVGPDGRIAYAAADGRSATATRVLDPVTGEDHALARRNTLGPSSWLPGGGLVTAQVEVEGSYRLVSDLYRVDDTGEHRLTRGAHLTGPDAAADGRRIVAVQARGGTNRLVVFDLGTGEIRPLTAARPDVHWAFPRWSPDGTRIAVGRWRRGAVYDIVVLDTLGAVLHELTHDRAVDSAPSWSPDGRTIVFSSDRSGIPNLYAYDLGTRTAAAGAAPTPALRQVTNLLTGAFFPDVSPDGRWVYFTGYHADGFHIERIPYDPATWRAPAPLQADLEVAAGSGDAAPGLKAGMGAAPDAGVVAGGAGAATAVAEARRYSPFASLWPRYWLPAVEGDAETGTFFGFETSGRDLVGRHRFTTTLAYAPETDLVRGEFGYRYAGFDNPVLDLDVFRDWDGRSLTLEGAPGARLLTVENAIAASARFLHQRWRSAASFSIGVERVFESAELRDAPGYALSDPENGLAGVFAGAAFANYQAHPFSISREDGVSLSLVGRRRWDLDVFRSEDGVFDAGYTEATAQAAAYKGIRVFGFADHVLAIRANARRQGGPGADAFDIGGSSGAPLELYFERLGGGRRFLPVRGFADGVRAGTRAWIASLEYRVPVALIERGPGLWPLFLDRLSASVFLDAGDAWCTGAQLAVALPGCDPIDRRPLVAAGAELSLDLRLLFTSTFRVRAGFGYPLREPGVGPVFHLQLGPSF